MTTFQVRLECYHGPLDLLVHLVKLDELDVLEIAVARIAAAYLEIFHAAAKPDIEQAGEFLVLASTLMEIKSRVLLPRVDDPVDDEPEEDTRQELVRRLLEYRRFREAADLLWERARIRQQKLARIAPDERAGDESANGPPRPDLELWDLVSAFSRLLKENIVPTADRVLLDQTPIAVYMERLESAVIRAGGLLFRDLLGRRNTRSQLIGKFLALLELIKVRRVWVEPDAEHDDLLILPPEAADLPTELPSADSIPLGDPSSPPDAAESFDQPLESPEEPAEAFATIAWDDETDETETAEPRASAWDDFEPLPGNDEPERP